MLPRTPNQSIPAYSLSTPHKYVINSVLGPRHASGDTLNSVLKVCSHDMSVVPQEWSDPGSTKGLLYDTAWMVALLVLFGVLHATHLFTPPGRITLLQLGTGGFIGGLIGIGLVITSVRRLGTLMGENERVHFAVIITATLAVQAGLYFIPVWLTVIVVASCLSAIPTRIYFYLRER